MGFQGDLDSFGLAAIFQTLTANKQSGTLHVFDETTHRYLVFSEGSIRSVSTGKRQNVSLGEILVARGILDETTLATALTRQSESGKNLLGAVLVDMGVCSQSEIDIALRFQMEEEIYDLFTWKGAKFEFKETPLDESLIREEYRVAQVAVNTSGIVLEAMRRIDEWERIAQRVPTIHLVPIIPPERQDEALLLSLSQEEKRIVSFLDGINDIDAITRKSCLGRYAVTQFVSRLVASGDMREATSAEMRESAAILTMQGVLEQAICLQRRIVELDPDDIETHQALADAYDALGMTKEAAEQFCQLAEQLCAVQRFDDAVGAASRAAVLQPDVPETLERLAGLQILSEQPSKAGATWLNVVRCLEAMGEKDKAFEKIEYALKDLPLHEGLNKAYARYRLARGESRQAIEVYERLVAIYQERGDMNEVVNTLRSILRIDSNRNDIKERLKRLQISNMEYSKRKKMMLAFVAVAGVFFLALIVGVTNELTVRQQIRYAIAEADRLAEQAASSPADQKARLLERGVVGLERAGESFSLFALAEEERVRRLTALQKNLEAIRAQVETVQGRQEAVLRDWERLRDTHSKEADEAFQRIRELASLKPITKPVIKAREFLQAYLSQIAAREKAIAALLEAVKTKGGLPKNRLEAYRTVLKTYPDITRLAYPKGLIGVTLPVRMVSVSDGGAALPATVMIGKQVWPVLTPCVIEMPVDASVPIYVRRRGFGDLRGLTVLSRNDMVAESYTVTLARGLRWKAPVSGVVEGGALLSDDGRMVFAATTAGDLTAIDAESGKRIWPLDSHAAPLQGKAVFRQPLAMVNGRLLLVVGENGYVSLLNSRNGKRSWPLAGEESPLKNQRCSGYVLTRLHRVGEPMPMETVTDLLVASQSRSPLFALDMHAGQLRWPRTDAQGDALSKRIGSPLGAPYHDSKNGHVYLVNDKGRLHLLLDDGTYVGNATLALQAAIVGAPFFFKREKKGALRILIAEEGVGIHCFRVTSTGPLGVEKDWTYVKEADHAPVAPLLLEGGFLYVALDGGRILRLALKDGSLRGEYSIASASITGLMARTGNRLLVPYAGREGRSGGLAAVQVSKKGLESEVWRFEVGRVPAVSGVSVSGDTGNGVGACIVFGDDRYVYRFDNEVLSTR